VDTGYGLRGRCELFLLHWSHVADCRVQAVAIVEPFDELEESSARCLARLVAGRVIEFGFHAAEEALHGRVVPAVSLAAHGATHAVAGEQTTIGMSRVLTAAIRVVQQAGPGPPRGDRHAQCVEGEFLGDPLIHRPAHDSTGEHVEDDREIKPTLGGRNIRDVRQPDTIRSRCREPSAEEIGSQREIVAAIRGPTEPPLLAGTNAMVVHQPRHPIAPDLSSLSAERSMHSRAAVATSAIAIHATDFLDQLAIGGRSHAFRSPSPRVVAAGTDVQHFAHHTHWERRSLVMDKAKSHFGGPEKMPMAFFKMSRSI
jgi:hypothetical protein